MCNAVADKACATSAGAHLEVVHVARIKAAAKMDGIARKARMR